MPRLLREIVAENIRSLRVRGGLTQAELARKSRLTDVYISRVEKSAKNLTLDSVEQIASALGVPVTSLLSGIPESFPKANKGTEKSIAHAIQILEAYLQAIKSK